MSYEIPKVEYAFFADLKQKQQIEIAQTISDYTNGKLNEKPQMLPVSAEEVLDKHNALSALIGNTAIGYISSLKPIEHFETKMSEVGSLWVAKQYRHNGVGYNLAYLISHDLDTAGEIAYAFCNPSSTGLFKRAGYVEAWWDVIPPEAFSLCDKCPYKPLVGCCDQTMVYTKGVEIGNEFHPSQNPITGA